MDSLKLDLSYLNNNSNKIKKAISDLLDKKIEKKALEAKKTLLSKTGKGSDFLGWVDLPISYDREELNRIKEVAKKIRKDSKALVVIGIGGSYLGARACEYFLSDIYKNKDFKIYYVGNNLSSSYIKEIIDELEGKDFSINIISKSGTTTEPGISFRIFRTLLEKRYGEKDAASRIYVTTDKEKGALKNLANNENYESFVVPSNIGGRFSVLSAVGLFPLAVIGINVDELLKGANSMRNKCIDNAFDKNDALKYAATRYALYKNGKNVEILANFEPYFNYIAEWWKQLFGESEGKDGKGIFPSSVNFTTDLHSLGQYIQDGKRFLFETFLDIEEEKDEILIPKFDNDFDELNYLSNKNVSFVNKCAMEGTIKAHTEGGIPVIKITIPRRDEYSLGMLFYFFEFAVAIGGYMLGVNPFNQPGVEAYKNNMFTLLEKPGYKRS